MSSIVSPDCRDKNHQKCPGDAWDELHDHVTECQCTCHSAETKGPKIQVWETEDAMLVIWGTHEPNAAYGAAVDWYEANSEVPDGLANEILGVAVTGAGEHWGDPAVLDSEESPWPAHLISRKHIEGWTPYMVVCW